MKGTTPDKGKTNLLAAVAAAKRWGFKFEDSVRQVVVYIFLGYTAQALAEGRLCWFCTKRGELMRVANITYE